MPDLDERQCYCNGQLQPLASVTPRHGVNSHVGSNATWSDGVDTDVVLTPFIRQSFGHSSDCSFGGRVRDNPGSANVRVERRNVDDVTRFTGYEVFAGSSTNDKQRIEVDVHDLRYQQIVFCDHGLFISARRQRAKTYLIPIVVSDIDGI